MQYSNDFLLSIINHMPGMIAYYNADLRCVFTNTEYAKWFNLTPDDTLNKLMSDILGAAYFNKNLPHIQSVLQGEPQKFVRHVIQISTGKTVYDEIQYIPHISNQVVIGFFVLVNDITLLKESENDLLVAKLQAETANKAKSAFLSSISHELRTPLNAILGFAQLLEKSNVLGPRQYPYLQQILQGGRHLLGLIEELLDLSRIEAGKLSISLEPVEINQIIEECFQLLTPMANNYSISLISSFACKYYIHADSTRVRQVLLNLISNAIKYNNFEGSVSIEIHESDNSTIRISVIDTGRGIHPENMKRLFEPFTRLSASHINTQGTGIGLSISKNLVELMDGKIGADNNPDQGCCFWIELPVLKNYQGFQKSP